jgi:hypothetical protein
MKTEKQIERKKCCHSSKIDLQLYFQERQRERERERPTKREEKIRFYLGLFLNNHPTIKVALYKASHSVGK